MDEKEIDNIAREIVAYYLEFRKVLNTSDYWKKVFKYATFSCFAITKVGFNVDLYCNCSVNIPNFRDYDGEPVGEVIKHWNNEVQYFAPHFKVVKKYENDREVRELLRDEYSYDLEANTLTKLFFFHLSVKKFEKISDIIFSSVSKYLPKDAKIVDSCKIFISIDFPNLLS